MVRIESPGAYTAAMFTGVVEASVPVITREARGAGARLVLPAPKTPLGGPWDAAVGDSISVSGCCLTVAALGSGDSMAFDLSAETLLRTRLGAVEAGELLNIERALRVGDRLGGHVVQGHVDGAGELIASADAGDGGRVQTFRAEEGFARYLVEKGSVTVDGVSLTVVEPEGPEFRVAVIPATLELTNLGSLPLGAAVHLEADVVGKWVERLLLERGGAGSAP